MTVTFDLWSLIQGVGAFIGGVLGIFILVMLYRGIRNFIARVRYEGDDRKHVERRWKEVEKLLRGEGEASRKLAVIEADKLLDSVLKGMMMPGDTMGDRLKFATYKFPWINEIWWAHRVRNQLAHESSYHLDFGVASKAVAQFKSTLQKMGAL